MAETFNPSLVRRFSQEPTTVRLHLPRAVTELIDHTEQGRFPRSGMQAMGRSVIGLVERIPQSIQAGIAYDFAVRNGILKTFKLKQFAFEQELKRAKELEEFSDEEREHWDLFIAGLDTSQQLGREAAALGLSNVTIDSHVTRTTFDRSLVGVGEELLVERAMSVLESLPHHFTAVLLPDYDEDDLDIIFPRGIEEVETPTVEEFRQYLETVRSPFIG